MKKEARRQFPFRYRIRPAGPADLQGTDHEGEDADAFAVLESVHKHDGDPDPDYDLKQVIAGYAKQFTPRNAEVEMTVANIDHKGEYQKMMENVRCAEGLKSERW